MVAPKKAALKEAEGSYEEVIVGLRAKQAELKVLYLSAMLTFLPESQYIFLHNQAS